MGTITRKEITVKKKVEVEIIAYGVDHSQYFQGHGTRYGSSQTHAVLGTGNNCKEAYADALESAYQIADLETAKDVLPKLPRSIKGPPVSAEDRRGMRAEDSELYYYVGIRW